VTPPPWDELYPTLDLHGDTGAEACGRAERWLRERQQSGARSVRIITGKGLHSVGPPVLRGEIEALLGSLQGSVVGKFTTEPGGGAFRVELLRAPAAAKRTPGAQRPGVGATAPDELRRRAEEALTELGIRPTPELIEAQIRRWRRQEAGEGG
jgi:hypothetical protein